MTPVVTEANHLTARRARRVGGPAQRAIPRRMSAGSPARYTWPMPSYNFRCRSCGDTFEVNRPMAEASAPAPCPNGHDDTVKLLTTFATVGRAAAPAPAAAPRPSGGCCGGGCCG
ncbi:zinc ribbon domain-containing protein [Nocardia cyriacigeorgica]|uniref:FmdB family zinc ribbon protein n=1 Tax=Nocardia cyriacigeorgica TaxID=135487 RepID=UPI002B4B6BEC|nr:zinc ribbon domain-containing protein [Nocardia cyriacigeorgica]